MRGSYLQSILAGRSVTTDDAVCPAYTDAVRADRGSRAPLLLLEKQTSRLLPESPYSGFTSVYGSDGDNYSDEYDAPKRPWRAIVLFPFIAGIVYAAILFSYIACDPSATTAAATGTSGEFEQWIHSQRQLAWNGVLANIGPAAGAMDGLVIASPSKGEPNQPDYYFTWSRDSALTVSSLLPSFLPDDYLRPWEYTTSPPHARAHNHTHPLLEGLVRSYARAQAELQVVPNPSGDLWSGGLSEPKFHVDGKPFTHPWGRPQRDGPALRALALIPYAHWLLDRGYPADRAFVVNHLYNSNALRRSGSVIKNDLEEIANMWSLPSFDIWEELDGRHLFTDAVTRRALQAGALLAKRLGDTHAAAYYGTQAERLALQLPNHFNTTAGYWAASHSVQYTTPRAGLDSASMLAVIHAGVRHTSEDVTDLAPNSPAVLSTLLAYVRSFAGLYSLNSDSSSWTDGWLVGRYAEDVYDGVGFRGGNPWYIATFTVAQVLYRAQAAFALADSVQLSPLTASFWADILDEDEDDIPIAGEWTRGSDEYDVATQRIGEVADAFLLRGLSTARRHYGSMAEQIGSSDGKNRGARDLTWSYASFLEVARARDEAKLAMAMGGDDDVDGRDLDAVSDRLFAGEDAL